MWSGKEILVPLHHSHTPLHVPLEQHLTYLHLWHFNCKTEVPELNNTPVLSSWMMASAASFWLQMKNNFHLMKDKFKWPTSVWLVVWVFLPVVIFNLPYKEIIKCALQSNTSKNEAISHFSVMVSTKLRCRFPKMTFISYATLTPLYLHIVHLNLMRFEKCSLPKKKMLIIYCFRF